MAPPRPRPSFRERMKEAASNAVRGVGNQVTGRGYQLPPVNTGIALAPARGAAKVIGMGKVFDALQEGIMQAFDRTRSLENSASRFRALLGRGVTGEARQGFLKDAFRRNRELVGTGLDMGLSPEDLSRVSELVAGSGAQFDSVSSVSDTSMLTAAIERGFGVAVENQAQFLSTYSRAGMMQERDGMSVAEQGREDLRRALSEGLSDAGAGLMAADIPEYLQEISMMMTDQVRSGIRLSSRAVTDLGATFRDSVSQSNRRLFQGFAGLASSQSVIGASRGVFRGQTAGIDQALLMAEARNILPNADLFDIANILETGGEGGEDYDRLFSGVLSRLRAIAPTEEAQRMMALSLQRNSTMFQDMGLQQILALLQGGSGSTTPVEDMTDAEIFGRASEVTGQAQKVIAAEGRADVETMQGEHYNTRLKIIRLEGQLIRDMRGFSAELEEKSVNLVSGLTKNMSRLGNILDAFNDKLNPTNIFKQFKSAVEIFADIISDMKNNEKTKTAVERRMDARRPKPRRRRQSGGS